MPAFLPVPLRYCYFVDVDPILVPSFSLCNLYIVATHMPLTHTAIGCKGPVLESVATPPLTVFVKIFVPEAGLKLKIHILLRARDLTEMLKMRNRSGCLTRIEQQSLESVSNMTQLTEATQCAGHAKLPSSMPEAATTDLIGGEGKELLSQPVSVLLFPFPGQKGFDGVMTLEKVITVTPNAIFGISVLDDCGVPADDEE
ncbi:MAG: hypothetical protein M1818_002042 [Claussenomyces sp. TS43310]|nr:MAG: hypothetical protein M1818_002042 [Claussenomyces sp. TS43310]